MRVFWLAAAMLLGCFGAAHAQFSGGGPATVGVPGAAGDVANFTTGGTAQTLFSGATPTNGFALYNPNVSDDCWASDSATAAANGAGSVRVVANGGGYETPTAYRPAGAVSLWCPTTGDKMTARRW